MGNDGGSIPKRRELVKDAARNPTISELKATALEALTHAWEHDPLTSERLDLDSVVSDCRGRLYNYESILKALMPAASSAAAADHDTPATTTAPSPALNINGESGELVFAATGIKSLRDVVRLKFKRHAATAGESAKTTNKDDDTWACPVSLKELGPSTKCVYLVPCGHVFAEVAMRQIQDDDTACPECSEPFKPDDVIPILSADKADVQRLAARMEHLRAKGLTHSLKKDKSGGGKKKRKADEANGDRTDKADKREKRDGVIKQSKSAANIASRVSGINNAATASLTARVLAEQEENNKRRKLAAAAAAR